ncbi:unnamed protein product [Prorocentrum cordatum]|uniref:Uncharacterized protein n=1 Tax=Prorocentrum cordatum TaxID=2364126 RepID=A0ABN9X4V1_9DINO|nr:unnamed protein product [Polarella glacialis]
MPATRSPSARTQERHGSTEPRKCAHQGLKKFKIAMRVEPLSPTLRCPAPLRNEGVEDGAEEEEEEEEGGEGGGGGGVTHAERERAAQGGIRAAARRANPPPQEGTLSRSATYDDSTHLQRFGSTARNTFLHEFDARSEPERCQVASCAAPQAQSQCGKAASPLCPSPPASTLIERVSVRRQKRSGGEVTRLRGVSRENKIPT